MGSLRIALDITSTVKREPTGIGNYVVDLVRALLETDRTNRYVLGIRPKRYLRRRNVRGLDGHRVAMLPLIPPWYGAFLGRVDVFHALGVRLPRFGRFRKVVTIHDLNTIDNPEFTRPDWARNRARRIAQTIGRADGVVTPSEFTRRRILERFSFPAERIRAVHHGVDLERYRPRPEEEVEAAKKKYGLDRPYILHVGAYVPRKNKEGLVRAFARSRAREDGLLALVGSKRGNFPEIAREAETLGLRQEIRYLGFVDRDEVAALLSGSRLFVFPSLYEGFGLPLLEAMACGSPVAAARASALPEVCGEAVEYFDPRSVEEISLAIDRFWEDEGRRRTLSEAGKARAAAFTWKRAAEQTVGFYQNLFDGVVWCTS